MSKGGFGATEAEEGLTRLQGRGRAASRGANDLCGEQQRSDNTGGRDVQARVRLRLPSSTLGRGGRGDGFAGGDGDFAMDTGLEMASKGAAGTVPFSGALARDFKIIASRPGETQGKTTLGGVGGSCTIL